MREGEVPDVVFEVIVKSPLLDKLYVYDGLKVPEVWLYKDRAFEIYRKRAEAGYDRLPRSAFLPELDFELVAGFVEREDQDAALREFAAQVG
jgi:Uma2 family endonuclease